MLCTRATGVRAVGDPTETALVSAADRFGLAERDLDDALVHVGQAPLDSARKRMTNIHALRDGGPTGLEPLRAIAAGAPYLAWSSVPVTA